MKRLPTTCSLAAFLFLSIAGTLPAGAWEARVIPSTRKVVPSGDMGFKTYDSAAIEGARGEFEAFQVIVKSDIPVNGVNVVMSDLAGPAESSIPAAAFKLYREWFLNVTEPSGGGMGVVDHERVPGLYPDPLIPFVDPYSDETIQVGAPFDITADDPGLAVVWIDLFIPADAVFGTYTGTATVSADGLDDVVIPVTLDVWELEIPKKRNVATSYGISTGILRKYHGGPEATASEKYPEIVRNYYKAMHEDRMDPTTTKGPVSFQFDGDGILLPVDWTAYDEYMQPWIDGTYFDDTAGIARFDAGMFSPGHGTGSWTEAQYQAAAAAFVEHLDDKGWLDMMWTYSTDEPWLNGGEETWNRVIHEAGLLHDASPLWDGHVLVTGPMYPGAEEVVDIWCPVNPMYDEWFYYQKPYPGRGDYDEHMADNGELWFYNCNANFPPYAGYDIDTDIGYEPRILKWGAFFEHATGFLHWQTDIWYYVEPWKYWQAIDVFTFLFARNGDGMLFYPGDSDGRNVDGDGNPVAVDTPDWLHIDGPVTSLRMKQIRDGLEDWEMFIQAENAGIGDWVRQELQRAYLRFGDYPVEDCSMPHYHCAGSEPWTLDEDVLLDVRRRVAAKLLFTLYPDRYTDPGDYVPPPEVVESVSEEVVVETASDVIEPSDSQAGDEGASEDSTTMPDPSADTVTTDMTVPADNGAGDAGADNGSGHTGGCSSSGGAAFPAAFILTACLSMLFVVRRRIRRV